LVVNLQIVEAAGAEGLKIVVAAVVMMIADLIVIVAQIGIAGCRAGQDFRFPARNKNIPLLQKFVTERGKMVSRRFSGISAKEQRAVSISIKHARFLGLLPVGSAKRK
jgi:small subunit ribosomal protein S18